MAQWSLFQRTLRPTSLILKLPQVKVNQNPQPSKGSRPKLSSSSERKLKLGKRRTSKTSLRSCMRNHKTLKVTLIMARGSRFSDWKIFVPCQSRLKLFWTTKTKNQRRFQLCHRPRLKPVEACQTWMLMMQTTGFGVQVLRTSTSHLLGRALLEVQTLIHIRRTIHQYLPHQKTMETKTTPKTGTRTFPWMERCLLKRSKPPNVKLPKSKTDDFKS